MSAGERFVTVVDVETTGWSHKDELIELAALRLEWPSWRLVQPFYARIRPTQEVGADVAKKNGYTPDAWADARPLSRELLIEFGELVAGADWVGAHPSFDEGFIGRARYKLDAPKFALASRQLVDVLSLGSPLRLLGRCESGSLDALATCLRVSVEHVIDFAAPHGLDVLAGGRLSQHTAMGDCVRTLLVYRRLVAAFVQGLVAADFGLVSAPPIGGAR